MLKVVENSPILVKKCRRCRQEKGIGLFPKNKRIRGGIHDICKDCHNAANTAIREKDRLKYQAINRRSYEKRIDIIRDRQFKKKFGISLDDYNKMFSKQHGKCKCCGIHQSEVKLGLAVDHNHETGKIRGLLCSNCNTALGLTGENIATLHTMIKYLETNK